VHHGPMTTPPPHAPTPSERRRTLAARLDARARGAARLRAATGAAIALGVLATGAVAMAASGAASAGGQHATAAPATARQTALATRRARLADAQEVAWERGVSAEALAALDRKQAAQDAAAQAGQQQMVQAPIAPVVSQAPPVVVSGGS